MPTYAIFLTVSLTLYTLMHVYVYRRVARAFPLSSRGRLIALAIGAMLVASPFVGRALDRLEWGLWSRAINLSAFYWMAWVFWFLCISLALGLWNVLIRLISRVAPVVRRAVLPPRPHLAFALVLILAATARGTLEAGRIRVREYTIPVSEWPVDEPAIRAVLISDVHLSTVRGSEWSRKVTGLIAEQKPDFILSAGDLLDAPYADIAPQAKFWASLHPPLGKFAILGNHDYYSGFPGAVAFHRDAGFRLLRGEGVNVGDRLRVAGLDDPAGAHFGQPCNASPALFSGLPAAPGRFTILLRHQPIPTELAPGVLDVQFSGHTHGGQVFPFRLIVRLFYRYMDGWYPMNGGRLYVSPGTGTWGPPLRLFAPPEIAVFILTPKGAVIH